MRVNDLFWLERAGAGHGWKLVRSAGVGWSEDGERERRELLEVLAARADSGRLWRWGKCDGAHGCAGNHRGCGEWRGRGRGRRARKWRVERRGGGSVYIGRASPGAIHHDHLISPFAALPGSLSFPLPVPPSPSSAVHHGPAIRTNHNHSTRPTGSTTCAREKPVGGVEEITFNSPSSPSNFTGLFPLARHDPGPVSRLPVAEPDPGIGVRYRTISARNCALSGTACSHSISSFRWLSTHGPLLPSCPPPWSANSETCERSVSTAFPQFLLFDMRSSGNLRVATVPHRSIDARSRRATQVVYRMQFTCICRSNRLRLRYLLGWECPSLMSTSSQ